MNLARLFLVGGLMAALPARAVYAPLPDTSGEEPWSVTLRAGVMYDSNIFGAQEGEIGSVVYQASPRVAFNGSLTDQTFAAFSYVLALDHFVDRPGDKTLDSHDLFARFAHAFSPTSNIDVSNLFQISRNPESLLAGLPVNTNQSYKRNEFDARFVAAPAPKIRVTPKFRSVNINYDDPGLAAQLDRTENLYGLAGSYAFLPELGLVGEYRRGDISYREGGSTKNKESDFLIGGFDYAVATKLSVAGRLGYEWRTRSSEPSTSGPYAEFSGRYDYARRSFLTGGYVHTLEESSDITRYNDTQVNRFFLNVQHAVSALIVASGSITYEPSELQGRRGVPNADETTTRIGFAITWLPTPRWSYSASFDYDNIDSDDPDRGQRRNRVGVSAGYTF